MRHRGLALVGLCSFAAVPTPASAALLRRTAPPTTSRPTSRIINGTEAKAGEYPAQAGLYIDANDNGVPDHLCGGTLVGTRQILTAAHCAVDDNLHARLLPRDFFVYLGVLNQNDFTASSPHSVAAVDVNTAYLWATNQDDTAML